MLDTYSRKELVDKFNTGDYNPPCVDAKYTSGRKWRKIICQYLSDDLLEKLSGNEENPAMLQLIPVLTLLDHGMCYTCAKYLGTLDLGSLEDTKQWLIDQCMLIHSEEDWVEPPVVEPEPDYSWYGDVDIATEEEENGAGEVIAEPSPEDC